MILWCWWTSTIQPLCTISEALDKALSLPEYLKDNVSYPITYPGWELRHYWVTPQLWHRPSSLTPITFFPFGCCIRSCAIIWICNAIEICLAALLVSLIHQQAHLPNILHHLETWDDVLGFLIRTSAVPRSTPSLATRMALTFLTPSSINNARAAGVSNRFNVHHRALSLQTPVWRDISISATLNLDAFQNAWWKGKVYRRKGWFKGLCGEGSEVPQRKGRSAGQ